MSYKASIDIGSNSILLLICSVEGDQVTVIENESNVTGLGRDLDKNGAFLQEAIDDSLEVLKEYSEICLKRNLDPSQVIVTATEASRVAVNAIEFIELVEKNTGFKVQVITGEGEAHYSAMGILFDKKIQQPVITIMDIGGASTELIKVDTQKGKVIESFSMPVGCVRMNNWNEAGEMKEKLAEIFSHYAEGLTSMKTDTLYCVAGTMTSIGNIYLGHQEFVEKEVNGLCFEAIVLDELFDRYKEHGPEDMLAKYPFLGKRSHTIHSGLRLAIAVLNKLKSRKVYISTYGLRYGTLISGGIDNEYIVKR